MARQRFSSKVKDIRTRSPERMMSSARGTNRVTEASAPRTPSHHRVRDYFIVLSGMGLLKVLRSALPKLALAPSATGKQTPPATTRKTASASGGAKAARVSWIDVLKQLYVRFSKDRVMAVAAGVTFYALLSIFPAIAAFVSLYGLIGDPGKIQGYLDTMKDVLPGGAIEIISDQVKRIASKGGGALGLGLIIGLATALWSANAGVKAMFDALNMVYEAEEKRSFFALNLRSLAFTIGTVAFLLIALTAIIGIPPSPVLHRLWSDLRLGCLAWSLARATRSGHPYAGAPLPIWALPRYGTVAMGHSGECDSRFSVAPRVGWFLLVRRQLRFL